MENMDGQGRAYQERRRQKTKRRTIRNVAVLIILLLVLIGLFAVKIFVVPHSAIKNMDYIEVTTQSGELYRIDITSDNCKYDAGGILIWTPIDGVLVMKNGESQPIKYDGHYDVFMLHEKYRGCFQLYRQ